MADEQTLNHIMNEYEDMENTKRIFKNPDKADEYNRDF